MGLPLHVINTSSYFYTFTSSLVNMETLPSLAVLTTLMSDVRNSSNMSASVAFLDNYGKGRLVTYLPLLVPPFANPTRLFDVHRIRNPNPILSASLI